MIVFWERGRPGRAYPDVGSANRSATGTRNSGNTGAAVNTSLRVNTKALPSARYACTERMVGCTIQTKEAAIVLQDRGRPVAGLGRRGVVHGVRMIAVADEDPESAAFVCLRPGSSTGTRGALPGI